MKINWFLVIIIANLILTIISYIMIVRNIKDIEKSLTYEIHNAEFEIEYEN